MNVIDLWHLNSSPPAPERRAGDGLDGGPSDDWRAGTLVGWAVMVAVLLIFIP